MNNHFRPLEEVIGSINKNQKDSEFWYLYTNGDKLFNSAYSNSLEDSNQSASPSQKTHSSLITSIFDNSKNPSKIIDIISKIIIEFYHQNCANDDVRTFVSRWVDILLKMDPNIWSPPDDLKIREYNSFINKINTHIRCIVGYLMIIKN